MPFSGKMVRSLPSIAGILLIVTCLASGNSSGRSRDRSSDRSISSTSTYPDFYRIEVDIVRLLNKRGILSNGKPCDTLSSCDTKLYGAIDLSSTGGEWTSNPSSYKNWPVIFSSTDNDNPVIDKTMQIDICHNRNSRPALGDSNSAVLRVHVVDTDRLTQEDEIGKFDCEFIVIPSGIASTAASARWGSIFECTSRTSQSENIKLQARQRAYKLSASECDVTRMPIISTIKT